MVIIKLKKKNTRYRWFQIKCEVQLTENRDIFQKGENQSKLMGGEIVFGKG